jgi:hypothetical protein
MYLSLLLMMSGSALGQTTALLPAGAGDLVPTRLSAATKGTALPDIERAPVSFAWAIEPGSVVAAAQPYRAESREYWSVVDAADLKAGFRMDTTAPGALIRISPADARKSAGLGLEGLSLRLEGREVDAGSAFVSSANADQLKDAGADFGEGTLAMRIAPSLGSGRFELVAGKASGRYLVHVFEPDSAYALGLSADKVSLLAGDTLQVEATLGEGDSKRQLDSIGGELTSPSGESFELQFKRTANGSYVASLQVPESAQTGIGLWEVHAFAGARMGSIEINRDARTAVGIGHATARLAGDYRLQSKEGLHFTLPVEVAAAGRYALRGTLFATGADGQMAAVAQSESARWLESSGEITLGFGKELVPLGYRAPFELRELLLKDQGRLADLERRAVAVKISADGDK